MRAYFSAQLLLGWRLRTILSSNTMSLVTMVFRRVIWLLFKDNVVILTGASGGIGEQLAYQLAAQGARLALAARHAETLEAVAAACRERGGRLSPFRPT